MSVGFERFDVAKSSGLLDITDLALCTNEELGKVYWALRGHLDTISEANVEWIINKLEAIIYEYEKRQA